MKRDQLVDAVTTAKIGECGMQNTNANARGRIDPDAWEGGGWGYYRDKGRAGWTTKR